MNITKIMLTEQVERLNVLTSNPLTPWTLVKTGREVTANIGNYSLDWAYGGVQLQQVCTESGGITHPLNTGYATKKVCFDAIYDFIIGIKVGIKLTVK